MGVQWPQANKLNYLSPERLLLFTATVVPAGFTPLRKCHAHFSMVTGSKYNKVALLCVSAVCPFKCYLLFLKV